MSSSNEVSGSAYFPIIELQCVNRNLVPKAKISSTTHVQLLQWLHGKQQQYYVAEYNHFLSIIFKCTIQSEILKEKHRLRFSLLRIILQ